MWGVVAIVAGLVIILALFLPAEVWWFLFASVLIVFGIWVLRCR